MPNGLEMLQKFLIVLVFVSQIILSCLLNLLQREMQEEF